MFKFLKFFKIDVFVLVIFKLFIVCKIIVLILFSIIVNIK